MDSLKAGRPLLSQMQLHFVRPISQREFFQQLQGETGPKNESEVPVCYVFANLPRVDDSVYPIPYTGWCWWDRHCFEGNAVSCPINLRTAGGIPTFELEGLFCSYECALAYGRAHRLISVQNGVSIWIKRLRTELLMGRLTKERVIPDGYSAALSGDEIRQINSLQPALHWSLLEGFGGFLDIDEFRKRAGERNYSIDLEHPVPGMDISHRIELYSKKAFSTLEGQRIFDIPVPIQNIVVERNLKRKANDRALVKDRVKKRKIAKPPMTKEQKERKEKEEKERTEKEKEGQVKRKPRTKMVHPVTMNRRVKAEAIMTRKRNELLNSKLPIAKKMSALQAYVGKKDQIVVKKEEPQ